MKMIKYCCCPAFLVAIAGPWLSIHGAVLVEDVIVQQLTNYIWIGGYPDDAEQLNFVARVLAALGKGITELEQFYAALNCCIDPQRFFPFIQEYPAGDRVVKFVYKSYLKRTEDSCSKPIFLAETETSESAAVKEKIVVKFVRRYNAKAHRLLADINLAPKLLYCSADDPNAPDLRDLIMVVMEWVEGKTAQDLFALQVLPKCILKQVKQAIEVLHENNIVFGDLRKPNIMLIPSLGSEQVTVKLVDFDWCGVHGEECYPKTLNDVEIRWHCEVKRGGIMKKLHDTHMMDNL